MPSTTNNSSIPRQPNTTSSTAPAASSTTKPAEAPSSRHVRVHRGEAARGAGAERIIGRPPGVA